MMTQDSMMIELLTEKTLLEYIRPRESWATSEIHSAKVKILFLAQLHNDYVLDNKHEPISQIVSELLQPYPIKYEVFDKWWNLTSLIAPDTSTEIINNLDKTTIEKIAPTNIKMVDEWLLKLIKEKSTE